MSKKRQILYLCVSLSQERGSLFQSSPRSLSLMSLLAKGWGFCDWRRLISIDFQKWGSGELGLGRSLSKAGRWEQKTSSVHYTVICNLVNCTETYILYLYSYLCIYFMSIFTYKSREFGTVSKEKILRQIKKCYPIPVHKCTKESI